MSLDGLPGQVTLVIVGYLLGSVSFSYLIVRILKGTDIRTVGSKSAGATNVLRVAGRGPAVFALFADAAKGSVAVLAARALDATPAVVAAVGLAAVLGHVAPVFFSFHGGKGVATAAGTLGTLLPTVTLTAFLTFLLVVAITRYVSLGSMVAAVSFPIWAFVLRQFSRVSPVGFEELVIGAAAIAAVIVFKHRANITRLLAGTEAKLGQKAAPGGPQVEESHESR